MTEEERHVSFDGQALGEALGTRPATVRDVAYGEGQLYSAGRGTTRLEVFPQTGVTRLTAQDMRVELFRNAAAAVSQTGVEFHRSQPDQEASLTVLPGGGVVFTFVAGTEPTSANPPAGEASPPSGQTDRHPARVHEPPTEPTPDTTDPPVQPPTAVAAHVTPPAIKAEPSPTPPRTASPAAGDTQSEPRQTGP